MNNTSSSVTLLNDLSVIEIAGDDAASFLHSQLTHDVAHLTSDAARLAGYCTAKGRLLASLVVWQGQTDNPNLYALVKSDIAQSLVKRLGMFVLRAKAKLSVTDLRVQGVVVDTSTNQATAPGGIAGNGPDIAQLPANAAAWSLVRTPNGVYIAAPSSDSSVNRWWFIGSAQGVASQPADASDEQWQAADIASGLPWVVAATQEVFIPQTLNLDLIDGVSFTKGCYPGQEVVARSHYRGTVKRRMAYGVADSSHYVANELPNIDIYDAKSPANPCGRVVNAACASGKTHLLMEIQLADLTQAEFRLGEASGPVITLHALPYEIAAAPADA